MSKRVPTASELREKRVREWVSVQIHSLISSNHNLQTSITTQQPSISISMKTNTTFNAFTFAIYIMTWHGITLTTKSPRLPSLFSLHQNSIPSYHIITSQIQTHNLILNKLCSWYSFSFSSLFFQPFFFCILGCDFLPEKWFVLHY